MIKKIKQRQYLICVDSDGTVMDAMTLKHVNAFGPAFIEIFNIQDHIEEILNEWNRINLYSSTRGINRFQGLKEILLFIKDKYNMTYECEERFFTWVEKTPKFSIELLNEEIEYLNYPENKVLRLAKEWSDLVNLKISHLPAPKMFDKCKETIKNLSTFADLLGVSSANKDAVYQEWEQNGISKYFMDISCQDVGTKTDIIKDGLSLGYQKDHVIMIGDAMSDYKAAKANGVCFYPILPTKEVQSWEKLNKMIDIIKSGKYPEVENDLIKQFIAFLDNGGIIK